MKRRRDELVLVVSLTSFTIQTRMDLCTTNPESVVLKVAGGERVARTQHRHGRRLSHLSLSILREQRFQRFHVQESQAVKSGFRQNRRRMEEEEGCTYQHGLTPSAIDRMHLYE